MSNQIERRVRDGNGNVGLTEEQRKNPLSVLPDDMPTEFRALAVANIKGDKALAESAHLLIEVAEENRSEEFRANAEQRLRETRAQF